MTLTEALGAVRYVVDARGEKTDAILPVEAWKTLVTTWEKTLQLLEDQDDRALLRTWLEQRAAGKVDMMPLEELERDLEADGFL
jgi:hypothetical protein